MDWYWDLLRKREQIRQEAKQWGNSLFNRQSGEEVMGLLGQEAKPAVLGQFGAPSNIMQPSPEDAFNRRFATELSTAQEGTGYLGSDRGVADRAKLYAQSMAAGYNPQQIGGLLSTITPPQQKLTSLQQNVGTFAEPGSPEYVQAMRDAVMKPQVAINNIPKPPANYTWNDPNNPGAGVSPIPGSPATKPTAAEAKQLSQGEMSQVMLGEINTIFDKGLDVSDPKLWAEAELAQIPFISWMTNLTPDEASMTSNLQQFENQYMAMLRGAQVGPAEQKLFRKQLPQIGQSKELFAENLKNSKRNLLIMIQRISDLRQFNEQGEAAPMVTPATTAPPPGFVRD